jgi:hypothetical protein
MAMTRASGARAPQGFADPIDRIRKGLVLPDSDDSPPGRGKSQIILAISLDIASNLFRPVAGVALGHAAMGRASMPKTTIDEDAHPLPGENEVR